MIDKNSQHVACCGRAVRSATQFEFGKNADNPIANAQNVHTVGQKLFPVNSWKTTHSHKTGHPQSY